MSRAALSLCVFAALLGASGVALAAEVAHAGGGDLGKTASLFLVLHGCALLATAALATSASALTRPLLLCGAALGLGVAIFSADLAARAFFDIRLFPLAAPVGGALMIASWIALALTCLIGAMRAPGAPSR